MTVEAIIAQLREDLGITADEYIPSELVAAALSEHIQGEGRDRVVTAFPAPDVLH